MANLIHRVADIKDAATAASVTAAIATAASDATTKANAAQAAATAAAATDATTKANAAAAASQPVDSDLTAIAALSTTSFGRSVLDRADASALRTLAGLGTASTHAHGDYEVAGAAASAQAAAIAASQPVDAGLTSIAALSTTSYGRALLTLANVGALEQLAGSTEVIEFMLSDLTTAVAATGDGKGGFGVEPKWNGWKLTAAHLFLLGAASSSGLPTVQIRRSRPTTPASPTDQDMLSTKITVDATEFDSHNATTPAVVDTASGHDALATGDRVFGDIDVTGTGAKGWLVALTITAP